MPRFRAREQVIEKGKVSTTIKNCFYAIKETWKFNKLYIILNLILRLFLQSVAVFESTYYMKYLVAAIEKHSPFNSIVIFVLGFFAIQLLSNIIDWVFFVYYQDIVWNRFKQYYNKLLFKKAGNVELSCFENPEFYNKYTMALDNTSERLMQVNANAVSAFTLLYRVVALFAAMFAIDKGVAVFLIFPIFGNFFFGSLLNKADQKVYRDNAKNNRIIAYVMRVLHLQQFSKEMRLTNIYPLIQKKHKEAVDDYCENYDKHFKERSWLFWSKNLFVFTLIFEGVLFYCAYQSIVNKTISLAEMTVMTSVMVSTTWGIISFFDNIMEIHNQGLYIQNARDFLTYEEKIPENYDGENVPEKIESIEFKNVSFGYKPEKLNIENVSFRINGGESVAFVGQNGAGKTTIVKLLFRLYDVTEGEILLNGKNIKSYNLRQYRKLFSAAFQDYRVIAMSVKDNISMGEEIDNIDETVENVLKKVELYDKVKFLENGVDTIMTKEFNENGAVLSGGQYQKLAVARAIAHKSPIFVFDEPSSALDPIAESKLFETIMNESLDKTMVFISHRLSSVKNADCVFMFKNGKLSESGTHKQLMNNASDYADMYSRQADNYLAREVSDR